MGFPDVRMIAGTATGDLQMYRGGTWVVEARICASADSSNPIVALEVAPTGQNVFVQCGRAIAGATDPDARDAFVYDVVTKQKRALAGTSAAGIGPIAPDGSSIVVAGLGNCPMPAPVCQTRRYLLDLNTGSRQELLPSDYWLDTEVRWTAAGLTYFLPECSSAGCAGTDKSGTYSYSFSTRRWMKITADRLVFANGVDRSIFERRGSLNDQAPAVVIEWFKGQERVLTPPGIQQEIAVGLLADGRTVAWRPDRAGSVEGLIVVYRDGRESQSARGRFSGYLNASIADVVLAGVLSGAPSWSIEAYSVSANAFASLVPTFSLQQMRVLPR